MFYPIPEGVSHSETVTSYLDATACETAKSTTRTATFTLAASTVPRVKQSNVAVFEVNRPTYGEWSAIKKSGSIKMTPMEIKNEQTLYEVGEVHVPYIQTQPCVTYQHKARKTSSTCYNCQIKRVDAKLAVAKGRYVEQGDLSYWKSKYPTAPHYVLENKGYLDQAQLEAAKSSVYAELFQAYNLGEEIAELRETIGAVLGWTASAIKLISDSKRVLDSLLKKGKIDLAADKWMEFRYGLMPMIFSIQDILALNEEKGVYRTTRKTVYPRFEVEGFVDEDDRPNVYFIDVGSYEIRANITAKARWKTNDLKKFDLININPLTTFTAVLPWSMVVRWFFNVQSYLDCRVKSLTSLALEHHACVAIREKSDYGTYLSAKLGYDQTYFWNGVYTGCGSSSYFGIYDLGRHTDLFRQDVLLVKHTQNNYNRYLFQPSDVKLVFSPHMTWQRSLDALVLAMRPMSKLLRRLK